MTTNPPIPSELPFLKRDLVLRSGMGASMLLAGALLLVDVRRRAAARADR